MRGDKFPIRSVTSMTSSGVQLTFPDGVIVSSAWQKEVMLSLVLDQSPPPSNLQAHSTVGSCLNAQFLQLGVNLSDTGSETQISKA
jgi:hypothetical protein